MIKSPNMMFSAPQYYHHEHSIGYSGPNVSVKQEIMDFSGRDNPVDMSLTSRGTEIGPKTDFCRESLAYDSGDFYNSCIPSFLHRRAPQMEMRKLNDNLDCGQLPSLERPHLPASMISSSGSASPPSINVHHGSDFDVTQTMPASMAPNIQSPTFSSDDLLSANTHQRAKREFVPDNKKDQSYWCKRLKNNDSARRSRVKRKALEKLMESRLMELQKENIELKHEVAALKRRFREEEGSSSDSSSSSSSRNKNASSSPHSTSSSHLDSASKTDYENRGSSSDDTHSNEDPHSPRSSRGSSTRSLDSLSLASATRNRDRTDSIGSGSLTSGHTSLRSRPDSRNSQGSGGEGRLRVDVTGALDLSSDCSNRSTPAWELSSSDSLSCSSSSSSSTGSRRRHSYRSSDGQTPEDSRHRLMVFPLKCRWKKEANGGCSLPLTEKIQ